MSERTVRDLVSEVAVTAQQVGMDVSVKDVGYIISLFLQGMALSSPRTPQDEWLMTIADECDQIKGP